MIGQISKDEDCFLHLLPCLQFGEQDGRQNHFTRQNFHLADSGQQLNILLIQVNKAGLQFRKLKANFGIAKEGALQVTFTGVGFWYSQTLVFKSVNVRNKRRN